MDEHIAKTPTNSGIRNINLVFDAPSFSLGLTQEDLIKVVSNPLQLKKSGRSKEIRSKFCNDEMKMTEILKKKGLKKTLPKEKKIKNSTRRKENLKKLKTMLTNLMLMNLKKKVRKRCVMTLEVKGSSYSRILICANDTSLSFTPKEFAIITGLNCVANRYDFIFDKGVPNGMTEKYFNGVEIIQKRQLFLAFTDKVVFKNIEQPKMELVKLEIPQKNVTEDECSVDSDDDFQDPPPKKHTQTRTPAPRAAKTAGMKTSVFKPIPTRQVPSSKTKKEKKIARVIFPQVQSKPDSHVEKVVVSNPESHVEKEAFISKKIFDAFREEQQHEDIDLEAQQMDYTGVETLPQQFSPTVDQNLGENQDATKGCTDFHPDKTNIEIDSQHLIPDELLKSINLDYNISEKIVHHDVRITDEKMDQTNLSDSQFTIPDELLSSLNVYWRERIITDPSTTREEEPSNEHFNDKKFEFVVQDHCQKSKYNPNRSYKFSTVDCNFMNIIRSVHDVYSVDDANLTEGGQAAHLNEYINGFRMHAAVP
ncbi:hypothetical protein FXO37_13885 [Capsicum annuum]|nr:hypothetical protein FXO37_13885 [Capsicum annuum]